ncbi:MAG TPA: glycosyltransferase family 39 protein [Solirubrobacteraceae bacterium]|nr:glycosyltransferase family 39 protein [Solirubrobacteraceae bacterium]
MSATVPSSAGAHPATARARALPGWWPLAALVILAAALRFSTLGLQSFWYDEAFTPVHVLHAGLGATLRSVVHTENTPPLWYVLIWGWSRIFGTGAVALRLPSALFGVATVPVAWAIGRELSGRRATAIAVAAFVAVNPLFVWYSQEARAYALFVLMVALAMLCFLRAERRPTPGRLAAFAVSASLALLSHYFAAFLVAPMIVMLLLHGGARRRATLLASGAVVLVGFALLPLASSQGGHGAQWIGRWALSSRLQAIPQYYLTGYSGEPLGHGIELLVALLILAGVGWGLWNVLEPREERGALIALVLAACGVLLPIVLLAFGLDYLAPRNLVAAMIPVSALIAVLVTARRAGRAGAVLAALIALAFLAVSIDVNLSPRLQRGDWRGVAKVLRGPASDRVITTVELGAAPLEYYLPPLRNLARGASVTVDEIDETGYAPLRASAGSPPAPGFQLASRSDVNGLIVYRFVSPTPRAVSEATLRRHVITDAHPEVLVSPRAQVSPASVE